MSVIELDKHRIAHGAHRTGEARCILCRHQWVAVAPVGVDELQCSACGQLGGRFWAAYDTGAAAPGVGAPPPSGPHTDLILFGCMALGAAGVFLLLAAVGQFVNAVQGWFA